MIPEIEAKRAEVKAKQDEHKMIKEFILEELNQQENLDNKKRQLSDLMKSHDDQKQKIKDEKIQQIDELRK